MSHRSPHLRALTLATCAAALSAITFPSRAQRTILGNVHPDTEERFSGFYLGNSIVPPDFNSIGPSRRPSHWDMSISFLELDRPNDVLVIDGRIRHRDPPPGHVHRQAEEYRFVFDVNAANYPPRVDGMSHQILEELVVAHGDHEDRYFTSLRFGTEARGGGVHIKGYSLSVNGTHEGFSTRFTLRTGAGHLAPTATAAAAFPDAAGSLSLTLGPADGGVDASFIAMHLDRADVTGIAVRDAASGATLLSFDPASFEDAGDDGVPGVAGSLAGVTLSPDAREAILAGRAVGELYTTDFPGGALQGALTLMPPPPLLGDINGDGAFDNFDIAPFEVALTDPARFAVEFPDVDASLVGDVNQDGALDNFDIAPFELRLAGAGFEGAKVNVPEPSGGALPLGVAALPLLRRRRRHEP